MFEVKPRAVEKKESSTETDEGLGSSGKHYGSSSLGSGSAGSGSLYLSDSQDWVVSPSCSPDEVPEQHPALSPLLAEETLRYMTYLALEPSSYPHPGSQSLSKVLSSDRVEQMTRTYNDIDVVTHLLAERDRDLELAARIGQSLLQRNQLLQERNEALEEQLAQAVDQVHQLQHELSKKDELLRMVASASEESETDSSVSTPLRPHHLYGGTAAAALTQLESLQNKLQDLEEENVTLRTEASQLKRATCTYEDKEQQLVSDCVKELRESNSQMVSLADELSHKNEELLRHQEEIAQLLSQIVELQHRVKELALEKEELRIHLQASKDAQRQLTAELNELTETNAECVEMLHESQDEIRELRNRSTPPAGMRRHLSYGLYPMDSLAAEIEGTMRRELSVDEETAFQDQRSSQRKVFQTVRSINASRSALAPGLATPPIPGSGESSLVMTAQPFPSTQGEEVRMGQPGSPGGNDLHKALHRLSLRRQNLLSERHFFQTERERKLQALAGADGSGCPSPLGSTLSSYSSLSELSFGSSVFKTFLPEKLQIVKPMEGSLTLHHWQQLAQPHLGTILDPHPGVVTKGFRPLAQDALYRLSDMEEDDESRDQGGAAVLEKGAAEQRGVDEEEEEGGITFNVHCSSTPEERRDRKPPAALLPTPPLSPAPAKPAGAPSGTPGLPPPPAGASGLHPPPAGASGLPPPPAGASGLPPPPAGASGLPPPPAGASGLPSPTSGLPPPPAAAAAASSAQTQSLSSASASAASSLVQNPGKCQSSTSSTYTFTTCRILHPSDVTQVTPSSQCSLPANTPSSLRTGPSTPVTPCRLSLGDSFPPRRAAAPPGGLAKLILERGISAQVSTDTPPSSPRPAPRQPVLRPPPTTPPNSPVPTEPPPHPLDTFLASRPAELFLQDVYGLNLGRSPHPDLPSPSQEGAALALASAPAPAPRPGRPRPSAASVGLVERLRRLGFAKVLRGSEPDASASAPRQDSATFVSAGGGSLLDGLRRNQSLPAMIGARAGGRPAPRPTPPLHPTSLALPRPHWGNLEEEHPASSSSRRGSTNH